MTHPKPRPASAPPSKPHSDLVSTIADQIIPRLVLAHASKYEPPACPDGRLPPTVEEIARFADLAVAQDVPSLLACVEGMSRDGLMLESLLLDLVAPAARLLGDQWSLDDRSFTEVTLGLGALQRVVAVLGHTVEPPLSHRGLVVLLAAPGEQHTLAVQLLGELLRQDGWGAYVDPGLQEDELVDLVASEPVVMVGFSVNNTDLVESTGRLIAEVKRASINPDLLVMVGGAVDGLSEFASTVGAIHCRNGREAIERLSRHERPAGADQPSS